VQRFFCIEAQYRFDVGLLDRFLVSVQSFVQAGILIDVQA
jgi:hypothetical protein